MLLISNYSQINLIKFVESNKFDKVYCKIWNIFVRSNFLKIWPVLIHQVRWMKNKSNYKSPQRRKNEENETTNESTQNIFVGRFSFGVLAFVIFVIYFVMSSITSTSNLLKHSRVILNFFYHFSSFKQHWERRI